MLDFTNLIAEYALRVALWPGLGLSLPLALLLLGLRRWLTPTPSPSQRVGSSTPIPSPSPRVGSLLRDLVGIAAALVLLATLPIPAPGFNLPFFGALPSGQQLADPLFAILLLPLASVAMLNSRGDGLRWLLAWLPVAAGLLAAQYEGSGLVRALAALACVPLLLTSDVLMLPRSAQRAERWLSGLAQQFAWLALIALLLEQLIAPLPGDPLLYALQYAATALIVAALARLVNRRWLRLAHDALPAAAGAALLVLIAALLRW